MQTRISDIRREYKKSKLTLKNLSDDPFKQFQHWLDDALHSSEEEPTAMIIATVSPDGHPSTRTVLLKGVENGKMIFFTNYESRKGQQLAVNPYVSLSFVWHKLERQIHIEGKVEKCPPEEPDTYFANRPYKSKIGARISPQSHIINSRAEIIRAFIYEAAKLAGKAITRPDNWGGFSVTPLRFEFWQGRENRLHDRFEYTLQADNSWQIVRLAP